MGEAILSRGYAGSSGGSGGGGNQNIANNGMITEIFTSDTLWRAPENLRNGQVHVRLFGGGQASGDYCGGNGGSMNNAIININTNEDIYISIGSGGIYPNNNGGTTSFGAYLAAVGSLGSGGGFSGDKKPTNIILQFGAGGATSYQNRYGSSSTSYIPIGGYWGGGGGFISNINAMDIRTGGRYNDNGEIKYSGLAGNGGYLYINNSKMNENSVFNNNNYKNAENGTNTIGLGLEFEGPGTYLSTTLDNGKIVKCLSGGGGYGGNGGSGYFAFADATSFTYNYFYSGGGGGGGYGADGGNGCHNAGGGGGGYGGKGGDGICNKYNIGDLASQTGGTHGFGGGGGGYGKYGQGATHGISRAGIAAGGAGNTKQYGSGGSGICIIQYWID